MTQTLQDTRRKRSGRKREGVAILCLLLAVGVLTVLETRVTPFDTGLPLSSTVLMFILININLLLLLTLLLLVFRNLAKLYYERKNNILGSKIKTRLTVAFVVLALLPTTVLFFFSIQFISTSIAFWFNAPVEQTLDASLAVGQTLYDYIEEKNAFVAKRGAFQIHSRDLLKPENQKKLSRYTQVIQRAFNCHAVEIYTPGAQRVSLSLASKLENMHFGLLTTTELMGLPNGRASHTVYQTMDQGEFLRTVCTIPFDLSPNTATGFIVITTLMTPDLSENLKAILKGVEEYHQLKLTKRPAQISYYIALSIVALLVVFCAVWFGFQIAKSITIPIMKFAEGTQRIIDGDMAYQIDFKTDDEIGTLIKSFNSMTRQLAEGRRQIALSESMLKQQNVELEKSRQYIEIVLKNIFAGVVSMDNEGTITTMNKAAESMLDVSSHDILNKNFRKVLTEEYLSLANKICEQAEQGGTHFNIPVSASVAGVPKHFSLNYTALKDDTGQNLGAVLVFDDVTELEKAQRLVAWREVARRIAHEVKNPLTPIKLSAQRLKRKYGKIIDDEVFTGCADTIVEHVDLIRNLVNQFAAFAKFPDTNFTSARIENIILETVALYKEGLEQVDIQTRFKDDIPTLKLDHQHMKQAFINLVDNAVYAINKKGTIVIDLSYDPILKIVRIEIADNGKGISDKEKTKLFEPYFSTKKTGMGLGLAIVNSIISDHNGVIRVQDNQPNGAKFIIELPAEEA
ncbi:PAS domain-containing sensor histidine kinase [Desulfobacter hydrogenophilus]|uniref:histidine kinase n=1 Tax=Desulfobacter hydrogenophilus TaxID=2291 RepID=A0A328FCD7_9BACT|nr:ATP-binding protein [Desulfobacter hydrogenophilus]NDY71715.1 PAS domain-containing protein [Desulfobacter hydrogenophilus]QBH13223.1 HAMP domain-containing protein [Desulfobacter hydrogenophilus]RAM02354.1 PAS domain-containing sensor histidine kinase [Desulfobacter hydrogenophilus]